MNPRQEATPATDGTPAPATELFPVGSVRVPWWFHLRVLRGEVTRDANGAGPRRMLLRDASGVLVVVAALAFVVSQFAPSAPADDLNGASPVNVVAGSGAPFPTGTLDLWTATPVVTPMPSKTQRVVVTRSTVPPWCADPQCTHFATPSPSPSPSPSPKPSGSAASSPSAPPSASAPPTATP